MIRFLPLVLFFIILSYGTPIYAEHMVMHSCGPTTGDCSNGEFTIRPNHPDYEKPDRPRFTIRETTIRHFSSIRSAMGISLIGINPDIRVWSHLTNTDRETCPRCTENNNYYRSDVNQIWMTDGSTLDDVIPFIIMYLQIKSERVSRSSIYSSYAKNERAFFFDFWQSNLMYGADLAP